MNWIILDILYLIIRNKNFIIYRKQKQIFKYKIIKNKNNFRILEF